MTDKEQTGVQMGLVGDNKEALLPADQKGPPAPGWAYNKEELAKICNLDNHQVMANNGQLMRSSNLIMNTYGGVENIMQNLKTSAKEGIAGTEDDKQKRIEAFCKNEFPAPHIKTICELILENFDDFINKVLLGAAIVSLIIGLIQHGFPKGMLEGVSIIFALCIIITVTSGNNYLSERRLAKLLAQSDEGRPVFVIRGGKEPVQIDCKDLLVGDVYQFTAGMKIPCDSLMVTGADVSCKEDELTGEPDAVEQVLLTKENFDQGAPTCVLIGRSGCVTGQGTALVMAVGDQTVSGVITKATQTPPEKTHLQHQLDTIANKIGNVGTAMAGLTFIAMVIRIALEMLGARPDLCMNVFTCQRMEHVKEEDKLSFAAFPDGRLYQDLLGSIIIAITVIVVAIPEGLPLAVTISLSFSSAKMYKLNNLVRKLSSSETMGGATHICSDKTGTLTENKMTTMAYMFGGKIYKREKAADDLATPLKAGLEPVKVKMGAFEENVWALTAEGLLYNSLGTLNTMCYNNPKAAEEDDVKLGRKKGEVIGWCVEGNATEAGIIKFFVAAFGGKPDGYKECEQYGKRAIKGDSKDSGSLYVDMIKFSSSRKKATIVVHNPARKNTDQEIRVYTKGAPDFLFPDCQNVVDKSGQVVRFESEVDTPDDVKEEITKPRCTHREVMEGTIKVFAKQAYRTILISYRDMSRKAYDALKAANNDFEKEKDRYCLEQNLTAVGIFGLQDPLRDGITKSIADCKVAGITTIMCTGDNLETATAISINAGIIKKGDREGGKYEGREKDNAKQYTCMTGEDFRTVTGGLVFPPDPEKDKKKDSAAQAASYTINPDAPPKDDDKGGEAKKKEAPKPYVKDMGKFKQVIEHLRVLGRSSPEDKMLLVTGIQACGGVVAVTGDGTNDAPALTKADVGFSMGITGTDVAQGASDIILLDDNFTSIVVALRYGRNIYDNVRKFLQFQLSVNVVAMFIVFFGSACLKSSPLTAVQMLWVNLIMDTFAALALATEAPEPGILDRQPIKKTEAIVTDVMWRNVWGHACFQMVILCVVIFAGQSRQMADGEQSFGLGFAVDYDKICFDRTAEDTCTRGVTKDTTTTRGSYNPYFSLTHYYETETEKFWIEMRDGEKKPKVANAPQGWKSEPLNGDDFDLEAFAKFNCEYWANEEDNKEALDKILAEGSLEDACNSGTYTDAKFQTHFKRAWANEAIEAADKWIADNKGASDIDEAAKKKHEAAKAAGQLWKDKGWPAFPWDQSVGDHTPKLIHFTYVFQIFVFMQVFNQINARKLKDGEINVVSGICGNWLFLAVTAVTFLIQMAMVQVGGRAVQAYPLTLSQNLWCLLFGASELVFAVLLKFLPLCMFQCISIDDAPDPEGHNRSAKSMMKSSSKMPTAKDSKTKERKKGSKIGGKKPASGGE